MKIKRIIECILTLGLSELIGVYNMRDGLKKISNSEFEDICKNHKVTFTKL